mmetsp:Transcript_2091/g.4537  ORF Transcript_2091/g.4537 Transcript_2091/m.4537 type:complete len:101 (-) Transcript_2091:291-593(-)
MWIRVRSGFPTSPRPSSQTCQSAASSSGEVNSISMPLEVNASDIPYCCSKSKLDRESSTVLLSAKQHARSDTGNIFEIELDGALFDSSEYTWHLPPAPQR